MKLAIWSVKTIVGIGICLGVLVFCIGPQATAAFASTAASVTGQGTGITIGSLGKFAEGIVSGRNAVNPGSAEPVR